MHRIVGLTKEFFQKEPSEIKYVQFLRFVAVGGFTASIDFFLYWILLRILNWHYIIAVTISFIIASSINYVISIIWVFFNGKYKNQMFEYLIFITFTLIGLLVNYLILYLGIERLEIDDLLVRLCSIIIVTIFNFLTKKFIVFKY